MLLLLLKKYSKLYWKEILFFGLFLVILLICKAPEISQKCYGNDAPSFFYGSFFYEARYPSPLYTILGWLTIHGIPFGNDGGNLVLVLSTIPAFLSSILVYLIVKRKTENKIAPFIGAAVVSGNYAFFSQSIITELYCLLAFFVILTYYFLETGRFKLSGFVCGLLLTIHYITGFIPFIAFVVANKDFRKVFYIPIIVFISVYVFYYLTVSKFYWEPSSDFIISYLMLLAQVINAFGLGYGFFQIFTGIWSTIQIICVSFAFSIIPIIWYIKSDFKRASMLFFMISFSLAFVLVGYWEFRFVQLVPFVPIAGVMAGLGYLSMKSKIRHFVLPSLICMTLSMPLFFDIGNTLDENPTTLQQMYEQIEEIEDGSLVMCVKMFEGEFGVVSDTTGGHVSTIVEYVNRTKGKNVIPVLFDFVFNKESGIIEKLEERGMSVPDVRRVPYKHEVGEDGLYYYIMNMVSDKNPEKDIYFFLIDDLKNERNLLVKYEGQWHEKKSLAQDWFVFESN